MKKLFWKVYQVTFTNKEMTFKNIQFFRGLAWNVVEMAIKEAEEKSKRENIEWSVLEIKKV